MMRVKAVRHFVHWNCSFFIGFLPFNFFYFPSLEINSKICFFVVVAWDAFPFIKYGISNIFMLSYCSSAAQYTMNIRLHYFYFSFDKFPLLLLLRSQSQIFIRKNAQKEKKWQQQLQRRNIDWNENDLYTIENLCKGVQRLRSKAAHILYLFEFYILIAIACTHSIFNSYIYLLLWLNGYYRNAFILWLFIYCEWEAREGKRKKNHIKLKSKQKRKQRNTNIKKQSKGKKYVVSLL